jgi:hypothetical protein
MSRLLSVRRALVVAAVSLALIPAAANANACAWHETRKPDTFTGIDALMRSQGATTGEGSWFFSWQGGLSRTSNTYTLQRAAGWPADIVVNHPSVDPDGTNHLINTHFGDIDYYAGKIYAPYEDGSEGPINNPDYQHPYVAVYDAKTLLYTGTHYELPVSLQFAGVPWVAINAQQKVAYTAEWDMPHDRINIYDLKFRPQGFIDLHYDPSLGPNFHLSRIQGAKVYDGALYATRDDDAKTVFKIDIATGEVTKLFSLDPTDDAELEGLAVRPTPDGSLLHVLIVLDNDTSKPQELTKIHVEFHHFGDCGG